MILGDRAHDSIPAQKKYPPQQITRIQPVGEAGILLTDYVVVRPVGRKHRLRRIETRELVSILEGCKPHVGELYPLVLRLTRGQPEEQGLTRIEFKVPSAHPAPPNAAQGIRIPRSGHCVGGCSCHVSAGHKSRPGFGRRLEHRCSILNSHRQFVGGLGSPTRALIAHPIDMDVPRIRVVPDIKDMAREDRGRILGAIKPVARVLLRRNIDLKGPVIAHLYILEGQISCRTPFARPGTSRIDLNFNSHSRSHLSPDTISLTASNWRECIPLVRVVPSLAKPEIQNSKIRVIRILDHLGFETLCQGPEYMPIAPHLLRGIPEGVRISNRCFYRLKIRGQLRKSHAKSIRISRRLRRRAVDTTEEPVAQNKGHEQKSAASRRSNRWTPQLKHGRSPLEGRYRWECPFRSQHQSARGPRRSRQFPRA